MACSAGDSWWSASSPVEKEPKGQVKFLVGAGFRKQTLTCDKRTLVSHSPYFATRICRSLDSDFAEWIVLPDDDPMTFEIILHCINGGQVSPTLSVSEALDAFSAAKKFHMDEATKQIRDYLKKSAKGNEVVDILEAGRRLCDVELQRSAWEYIVPRSCMLLKSNCFLRLSRASVCEFLLNEDVVVPSELDVFTAVMKWTEEECKRLSLDYKNCRQFETVLGDLLSLIRFPAMKRDLFNKLVVPRRVLQRHDCELLEHYWNLRDSDPVSAEAMDLPFEKSQRTGPRHVVAFFHRQISETEWKVAVNHWSAIKLQSECSILIHSLLLYGKPEKNKVTQVHALLLEQHDRDTNKNSRRYYSTVTVQNGTVRVMADGESSRLELENPLSLVAGRKYLLKICFLKLGFGSKSFGTLSGTSWTLATAECEKIGDFRILAKKVKGGDCLLHSLEFALAPTRNKDTEEYSVQRESIKLPRDKKACLIV